MLWTLCRLAQGVVLLYVWRIHANAVPARDWAVGSLLAVPGLVLAALHDIVPDWASIVLANAFVLAGWMVFDCGIVRAAGRRPAWRWGAAVWVAAVVLLAWFSLFSPHYPSRVLVYTAAVLLFDGWAVAACLSRNRSPGRATTLVLIGGILATQMLSAMLGAGGLLATGASALPLSLPTQIQYGYVSIVGAFLVTPLLALLPSQTLQEELRELARRDPLTLACNRRILDEVAANHWNWAENAPVACLLLDIDHFKLFNDAHGHQAGDAALVAVSRTARSLLRTQDVWCRFGGEEFLALLPHTEAREAMRVAERLRATIAGLVLEAPGGPAHITVSIGVVEAQADTARWPELLGRCDQALYRAKSHGRDRVELFDATVPASYGHTFVRLVWNASYACGLESIDVQHQQLFTTANELLTVLLAGAPKPVCQEHIEALLADVLRHFQDEEAVLRTAGYAEVDNHATIHQNLLGKARELARRFAHDALPLGELFDFLAMDVVSEHMLSEDRKFFPCLHSGHPLATPPS